MVNLKGISASIVFLQLSLWAIDCPADPPSKSVPAHSSTAGNVDQYVPDKAVDPTVKLQRMHDNIESKLGEADRKLFETSEAGIHGSAARESFYRKICAQFNIDPY